MSEEKAGQWFRVSIEGGNPSVIYRDSQEHLAKKNPDTGKWEYNKNTWDLISWRDGVVFTPIENPNL